MPVHPRELRFQWSISLPFSKVWIEVLVGPSVPMHQVVLCTVRKYRHGLMEAFFEKHSGNLPASLVTKFWEACLYWNRNVPLDYKCLCRLCTPLLCLSNVLLTVHKLKQLFQSYSKTAVLESFVPSFWFPYSPMFHVPNIIAGNCFPFNVLGTFKLSGNIAILKAKRV